MTGWAPAAEIADGCALGLGEGGHSSSRGTCCPGGPSRRSQQQRDAAQGPSCPGLRGQSGATGSGGGPGWGRALPEGRCPVGHLQGAQGDAGREGTPPRHSPDSGCGWLGWALVHLSPKQIGVPTVTGQSGPAGTGKNTTRLEALTVTRRPAHWLLDTQDIWLWLTLSQELSQVPSPGTCPAHTLTESGSLEGAEALTLSAPTPVNTPPHGAHLGPCGPLPGPLRLGARSGEMPLLQPIKAQGWTGVFGSSDLGAD